MDVWQDARRSAARAFFLAFALALPANAAEKLELPEGFSLWQPSASLRVGVGYKDNVTLSSFDSVGSGFELTSVEAMLFRLPWNNWQITAFAAGSDARYFDQSTGVNTEQNAAASAQFGWFPGKNWKSTTTFQYIFMNQVMDVSVTYGVPVRQQVYGHGLVVKEGVRKSLGRWWAELEVSANRFLFREPLDSYWQGGPLATLGRYYGYGSEVSLSYQVMPLAYDHREKVDRSGMPVPDTELRFLPQRVELGWRHYWEEKRYWRNTTRLAFQVSRDNGSGYFNYNEYRLVEELTYRPSTWEFTVRASVAYYDTPNQAASLDDFGGRHRTSLLVGVRADKKLAKHWKVYAAYDYDRSFSNLVAEQYEANTGSAGIELTF